jgi:hypothetical protein
VQRHWRLISSTTSQYLEIPRYNLVLNRSKLTVQASDFSHRCIKPRVDNLSMSKRFHEVHLAR